MGNKFEVLIIEDDDNISSFLKEILESFNYSTFTAFDGKSAVELLSLWQIDLVLLDLGLPDIDGMEIIKTIRKSSDIPIIVVSARDKGDDKVAALDMGTNDYVTKPFDTPELLARIRSALRNYKRSVVGTDHKVKNMQIQFDKRRVIVNGMEVHFTQNEYKIIELLSINAGKVLTYNYIITNVWGPEFTENNKMLRVNMANIRRKLEAASGGSQTYIYTESGVGYRLVEDEK